MSSMHGGLRFPGAQGDLNATLMTKGEVCLKVNAPAVTEGESVAKGQCIGMMGDRVVLAPWSGLVSALSDGAVKIRGDGESRTVEAASFGALTGKTLAESTPEELLTEIRNAGIVEADGKALADHIAGAMERSAAGKLNHAVISLLEPDPASVSNASLGVEYADAIAGGLAILLKILKVRQGSIVCDSAHAQAVSAIQAACRESKLIAVEVADNRYPMANPKLLLRWLFQKEMSYTSTPETMGVFLTDAESCIAVHQLFATGIPRLSVRTTVYEKQQSRVYDLPLGLTLASLKTAGIWETLPAEDAEKHALVKPGDQSLWCMGLMNGARPADPIDRSVTLLMSATELPAVTNEHGECIRCGRCGEVCPMYLSPNRYLPEKPWITFFSGAPRDAICCIGCGCCSYVCPAELPLRRYALRAREEERIRLEKKQQAARQSSAGNPGKSEQTAKADSQQKGEDAQ